MDFTARPFVTTGVVLATAGMIAATPLVAPARAQVHTADIRLASDEVASLLESLLGQQLAANSATIDGVLSSNAQLVLGEQDLTPSFATLLGADVHADGSVHGLAKDTVEQFFDANNALGGASQAAFLGMIGARGTLDDGAFSPVNLADLNTSLLVDVRHTASIPFAGLESAIGHYIGAAVFLSAHLSGIPEDDLEASASAASFLQLTNDVSNFNDELLAAQQSFNTNLVEAEVALEQALFGTDSAYNGVINRAFNAFNMLFDAQQQSFNGLLGVTDYNPQDLTASLLTGSDAQIFNDGSVGGLLGTFDQSMAMLANLGGLFTGAGTGIPDGFEVDPDTVGTAFTDLFTVLGGGPFGDVFGSDGAFSDLLAELGTLLGASLGG